MKLGDLAFACYLYGSFTEDDMYYADFLKITNNSPDLEKDDHRVALIKWLNQWGCRQFAIEYHDDASKEILIWYRNCKNLLMPKDKNLWELTEMEISSAIKAYGDLSGKIASCRINKGKKVSVRIGPTGAAKILFAIRPKSLLPWDIPIREELDFDETAESYKEFIKKVIAELDEIDKYCKKNGIKLVDLPEILNRPYSTVPKLIDEYYWVTITNKCTPPKQKDLEYWINWNKL